MWSPESSSRTNIKKAEKFLKSPKRVDSPKFTSNAPVEKNGGGKSLQELQSGATKNEAISQRAERSAHLRMKSVGGAYLLPDLRT